MTHILLSYLFLKYLKVQSNNDNPWDPKIVAVVDRWSLFRGDLMEIQNWPTKWWSLQAGGGYSEMEVNSGWTVYSKGVGENKKKMKTFRK